MNIIPAVPPSGVKKVHRHKRVFSNDMTTARVDIGLPGLNHEKIALTNFSYFDVSQDGTKYGHYHAEITNANGGALVCRVDRKSVAQSSWLAVEITEFY